MEFVYISTSLDHLRWYHRAERLYVHSVNEVLIVPLRQSAIRNLAAIKAQAHAPAAPHCACQLISPSCSVIKILRASSHQLAQPATLLMLPSIRTISSPIQPPKPNFVKSQKKVQLRHPPRFCSPSIAGNSAPKISKYRISLD